MKGKEKQQRRELEVLKQIKAENSSDDDDDDDDEDDSDVEKNFTLLSERGGGAETEEGRPPRGEEEDGSSEEEEEEEERGSDSGDEDEEELTGGEDEDGDSEASEDEDPEVNPEVTAGGSSNIQTRDDLKEELSNMSFEDIIKLQNKVGTKVYNQLAHGASSTPESRKKKRLNKNRPVEISAKTPVPFLRQVAPIRKQTSRDPRFDDLSGEYKPEIFEKTYKFIDDIKHREKEVILRQLKRRRTSNQKKEKLQFLLKRMENQERARKSREQERERELQLKRQQRERANQGERPFFLKKSEKKKLQLADKYQELKKSGKLENFLSKKRKRNAGKDRRKLPRPLHSQKAS